jgi:hypothetical protein
MMDTKGNTQEARWLHEQWFWHICWIWVVIHKGKMLAQVVAHFYEIQKSCGSTFIFKSNPYFETLFAPEIPDLGNTP